MSENQEFYCTECGKKFKFSKTLRAYLKKAHLLIDVYQIAPTKKLPLANCTVCSFSALYTTVMADHYSSIHNMVMQSNTFYFKSLDDFKIWKHSIEQRTNAYYVKNCGLSKHMSEHVGHQNNLGNLQLDKVTRDNIASKISEHIFDEIRDNISNNVLERTHLLTKKDLYNIEASYDLNNEAVLHKNYALSVENWVDTVRGDGKFSLVYYKPQDKIDVLFPNLKKEDFVLIIMNNYQKSMLEKCGNVDLH